MLKAIIGILLVFIIAAGGIVYYIVPEQFHRKVHHEILPELSKDSNKVYKQIDKDTHQTVITNDKIVTTVTSVTELNPLKNYVLVEAFFTENKNKFEAKIYSRISDQVSIHIELKDYISIKENEKISIVAPRIIISTPLNKQLINAQKRMPYILTNTKLDLLVKNISGNFVSERGVTEKIAIQGFSWTLATKSQPTSDKLKLLGKIEIKEADIALADHQDSYKNFEQVFELDSFSKMGFKDGYEKLLAALSQDDQVPMAFKMMSLLPTVKALVSYPFQFNQTFKAQHKTGGSRTELKILLRNLDLFKFEDAFEVSFDAKFPKEALEDQLVSALAVYMARKFSSDVYPVSEQDPSMVESLIEREKIHEEIQIKLVPVIKDFFKTEVEGKKRISSIIEEAVRQEILKAEGGDYLIRAEFLKLKLTISNKESQLDKITSVLPREELLTFLQENGFVLIPKPEEGVPEPMIVSNLKSADDYFFLEWIHGDPPIKIPLIAYTLHTELGEKCLTDNLEPMIKACMNFLSFNSQPVKSMKGLVVKCGLKFETNVDYSKVSSSLSFMGFNSETKALTLTEPVVQMDTLNKTCKEVLEKGKTVVQVFKGYDPKWKVISP